MQGQRVSFVSRDRGREEREGPVPRWYVLCAIIRPQGEREGERERERERESIVLLGLGSAAIESLFVKVSTLLTFKSSIIGSSGFLPACFFLHDFTPETSSDVSNEYDHLAIFLSLDPSSSPLSAVSCASIYFS